jgi:hypothetical protein
MFCAMSLLTLATVEPERALILRRAARAAAYLLTITAQPRDGNGKDLSQELLEHLARHPDPVTARLSKWALSFRFADDGSVRPLLYAVEYEGRKPALLPPVSAEAGSP